MNKKQIVFKSILVFMVILLFTLNLMFLFVTVRDFVTKEKENASDLFAIGLKIGEQDFLATSTMANNYLDLDSFNCEAPTSFAFTNFNGYQILVGGKEINANGQIDVMPSIIDKNESLTVEITHRQTGATMAFHIRTLHSEFPQYYTVGESTSAGDFYFDTFSPAELGKNFIIKMDNKGKIVFYKRSDAPIMNFQKTVVDNKIFYSYFQTDVTEPALSGFMYGDQVILDEQYNVIDRVRMGEDNTISAGFPLENHEFIILGEKHYLLNTYLPKRVNNIPTDLPQRPMSSGVCATLIQEIKDGTVIWSWDSTKHEELYGSSLEANDYTNSSVAFVDYLHLNSMTIDPADSNVICSFRHLDAVLKIDRVTGDIIWTLGGKGDQFKLAEEQKFSRQHFARIDQDGWVYLFDNGVANQKTKIRRYLLNETIMEVQGYEEYVMNGQYAGWGGSASLLPEVPHTYVIGWAGNLPHEPDVSEMNMGTNEIVLEIYLEGTGYTYRAIKR